MEIFKKEMNIFSSMSNDLEKAQVMFKLLRKDNWGAKYDRTEHFKRFPNLNKIIKELHKMSWVILKKKANYLGISLNPKHKKEIEDFIIKQMPHVENMIM